jgi:UDP-glucose 4-epimerase
MNIFLTGGTGFIGSYVTLELLKHNHKITILARNPDKIPKFKEIKELKVIKGYLSDSKLLKNLIKGKDACIHIALNYSDKKTGWEVLLDDTLPTVFMSNIAARENVKHFIYTSSTSANDSLYSGGADELEESIKIVDTKTKQHPATFYGATKAASENFLMAQSHLSPMRINIIRPGYTFGNPVAEGAHSQSDTRFQNIVKKAFNNEPTLLTKNDGTQFIWAGDLAKLYIKVLHSSVNRKTYFGLSKNFTSWYEIAREAIKKCNSKSQILLEDKGWSDTPLMWDVSDMKEDFGLEFDPWEKIKEHLDYYIHLEKKTKNA